MVGDITEVRQRRHFIEIAGLPFLQLLPIALKEGNSRKPVYRMHKWWARRLGSVFRAILVASVMDEGASEEDFMSLFRSECSVGAGFTVFDPFVGGGTTLVEAQQLGFEMAGCEIDPVAWYVSRQELAYVEPESIQAVYNDVCRSASSRIIPLYTTATPDGKKADIVYAFWVSTVECPQCRFTIELHPHYQLYRNQASGEQTVFCSACHTVQMVPMDVQLIHCSRQACGTQTRIADGNISASEIKCPNCGQSWARDLLWGEQPADRRLFAIEYLDRNLDGQYVTRFKAASSEDIAIYQAAEQEWSRRSKQVTWMKPFLRARIPEGERQDRRPISYGYRFYHQLFNARQLLALSYIGDAVVRLGDGPTKEMLLLALSDCLASNNMLCSYAFDYKKLTPLFGLHGYQIVTRPVENNAWGTARGRGSFTNCVRKIQRAMQSKQQGRRFPLQGAVSGPGGMYTAQTPSMHLVRGDARDVSLPDKSVDLIVTDPPYFDNLQYGELSDLFFAWLKPLLRDRYPSEMELLNCIQLAGSLAQRRNGACPEEDFARGLAEVFIQCRRVLKGNGLLVFTFHHRNHAAWEAVKHSLCISRFRVMNVVPVRSEGRSGFHSSPGNLRWDAVLVCRKAETIVGNGESLAFQVDDMLSAWQRTLNGMDGAPTSGDWHSLRTAIEIANAANHAILS